LKFDGQFKKRDLIEEIQNQGPKCKSAKIKGLILNLTCFGASFHLNRTACFAKNGAFCEKQRRFIHFFKKKAKTVLF